MNDTSLPDCSVSQSLRRHELDLNREKQTGKLVDQGRQMGSIRNKMLEGHASPKGSEDAESILSLTSQPNQQVFFCTAKRAYTISM